MAPFPDPSANYYPGLRRSIGRDDGAASAYVDEVMNRVAPFVAGAFDAMKFDLVEASFSIVTTPADKLLPVQRAPHFDSTNPDYVALIHYLNTPATSGTAFFRHRATGVERVTDDNCDRFVNAARHESFVREPGSGYVQGSDDRYEELDRVEARPDRLVFYQGGLLHSGIIPPDLPLDPDPRKGRLTANFFIRLNRETAT